MKADKDLGKASVEELQTELKQVWVRLDKQLQPKMAALLYYLREKLKAQGRKGEGFNHWIDHNIGVSRSTCNRWADEYAEKIGAKQPKRKKDTFSQMSKGARSKPAAVTNDDADQTETDNGTIADGMAEESADGKQCYPLQLYVTKEEWTQLDEWEETIRQGEVDDVITPLVLDAFRQAAERKLAGRKKHAKRAAA